MAVLRQTQTKRDIENVIQHIHPTGDKVIAAGQHLTATTEQDTQLLAQRHQAWAVKGGIGLFTRGEATDAQHPVQDTGIRLHAASGNVNVQAQSAALSLTAKQSVDLQSTQASVHISAPQRITLNGAGSYLLIDGGNIELGTSGPAQFKAAAKELAGGSKCKRKSTPIGQARRPLQRSLHRERRRHGRGHTPHALSH